jgi:beta-glucosidase
VSFPQDFLWGAATSAYQVEGATTSGGRGASIWDTFCRVPGAVVGGATGDVACDHYHRWEQDLDLLASLGLRSYRFSISWPRVLPEGRGAPNEAGLAFYHDLCSGLLARGIRPVATLYHWDLPQALEVDGGWLNRDVVDAFADYADLLFDELGPLVEDWVTINEPWVIAFCGYAFGTKAPGRRNWPEALQVSHHALLAHARALERFRDRGSPGRIGLTLDLNPVHALTDDPEDRAAARRLDGFHNRWFLDPVFRGGYPTDMLEEYGRRYGPLEGVQPGDLDAISAPCDFLGVNFYKRVSVRANPDSAFFGLDVVDPAGEVTAMGWEVYPAALHEILRRVREEYTAVPIMVTENGAAYDDLRNGGEVVDDPQRVAYISRHIDEIERAIADGVPVAGYFAWSLLDNFEWEHGYSKRFGLVYVDYTTQERIPKTSALWYRDHIERARNGHH